MDYCKRYNRILISNEVDGIRLVTRTRCKQWDCPHCGDVNRRMWYAHALDNINRLTDSDSKWWFVTVTASGGYRTQQSTLIDVQKAWRYCTEFWRDTHRRMGLRVPEYLRVYETHKDNTIHLHAIVMSVLPLENYVNGKITRNPKSKNAIAKRKFKPYHKIRIKDLTAKSGAGYKSEASLIEHQNAGFVVSYVMKYLTKELQSYDAPKNFRRVQTSEGFSSFGSVADSPHEWTDADVLQIDEWMTDRLSNIHWRDIQKQSLIKPQDWQGSIFYPPLNEKI